jgi:hypothetical protein
MENGQRGRGSHKQETGQKSRHQVNGNKPNQELGHI